MVINEYMNENRVNEVTDYSAFCKFLLYKQLEENEDNE